MPKNRIGFSSDFVLNDSKIGIGTTNPTQLLQVGIETSAVVVTSSGNLGIGTTNPIQKFQVNATSSYFPSVVSTATSIGITTTFLVGIITSGITPGMEIQAVSGIISTGTLVSSLDSFRVNLSTPTLNAGIQTNVNLTFGLRNDAKVVVNSLGYVGIGTTNPFSFLDVTGNVRITSVGATSGENIVASHTRDNGGSLVYQNQTSVGSSTGNVLFAVTNQADSANPDLIYVISDSNARPLLTVANSGVTTISNLSVTSNVSIGGSARVGTSLTVGTFIQTPIVSFLSAGATSTSQIVARHYTDNQGSLVFERGDAPPIGAGTSNQQIFTITSDDTEGLIYAINDSNARTAFAVATSGNVGIATTNPIQNLHIETPGEVVTTLTAIASTVGVTTTTITGITTTGISVGLRLATISNIIRSGTSVVSVGLNQIGISTTTLNQTQLNSLQLGFGNRIGSVVVDSMGEIGIGTTTPLQKLDVRGSVLVASGTSTGQHITLRPVGLGTRPSEPATESLSYERLYAGLSTTNTFPVPLLGLDGDYENVFNINSIAPFYSVINVKNNGRLGFGTTSPATRFDVNVDANFRSSVGIGTTIPRRTLDLIGTTLLSNVGSSSSETFTVRPYNVGINSRTPVRGALNYESDFSAATKSGGKIVEISNDNTNLFTVNAFRSSSLGFSTSTDPFFTAVQVTQLGNVGIATDNPIQRLQVGSRNDFVPTIVATASTSGLSTSFTVGITTNTILGINTAGITTGLIIQEIADLIPPGTTVVSIGTDNRIGISTLTLNGVGRTDTTLTLGRRGDDNIVVINSTGSVGIGTTNPIEKFDLRAPLTLSPSTGAANTERVQIRSISRDNGAIDFVTYVKNQLFSLSNSNADGAFRINRYAGITTNNTPLFIIGETGITTVYSSLTVSNDNTIGGNNYIGGITTTVGTVNVALGNSVGASTAIGADIYGIVNVRAPFSTTTTYVSIEPKYEDGGALSFQSPIGAAQTDRVTQLFSISNNIGTSIFRINDLNRNPILEASVTGNLGIGTTSPQTKLEVLGTARVTSAGSTAGEQINIRHYRNVAFGTVTDNKGAISFDASSTFSGFGVTVPVTIPVSLFSITNDVNDNVFSVAGYTYFSGGRDPGLDVTARSRVGIGTTNPRQKFDVVGNTIIDGNVGIGTTTTNQKLEVVGVTRITSAASTTGQQIDLRHLKTISGVSTGVSTSLPPRGSLVFDGLWDLTSTGAAATSTGGQLLTILNDNTSLLTVNRTLGFSTFNPPPTATRFVEPVIDISGTGNIGIGNTTNVVNRVEINSRNEFVSSVVAFASSIGITTNLIGISTTGLSVGLEIQAFTGVIAAGTTVISIGSSIIGIGRSTLNDYIRPTGTPLTFGTRTSERVVAITSTGFVGIRTTNPVQPFQVGSGSSVVVIDTMGEIGIGTTNPVQKLQVGFGTNVFVVTGVGSVGIGTTNPLQELHIFNGDFLISAGSSTGQHIVERAYELDNGTLSWEGANIGQLFSLTNNLTGSVFGVNEISGIPVFDVNSNGTVSLVPYYGNLGIGTTLPSQKVQVGSGSSVVVIDTMGEIGIGTTNPTAKLDVLGNANISGIVTVGLGSTSSPSVNSTMSFELTNDTTLTVRVRGSDGTTRVGIITLS